MTCPLTCQHMTPSTAIEGSKTFSLALILNPWLEANLKRKIKTEDGIFIDKSFLYAENCTNLVCL